jgi:assimilatory nitrate reductase catalytic subunit
MSRNRHARPPVRHVAEPSVEMHAQDVGVVCDSADGDLVHVDLAPRQRALPVQTSSQVAPAQSFIAMHWGEEFLSGSTSTGERWRRQRADLAGLLPELQAARAEARRGQDPEGRAAVALLGDGLAARRPGLAAREQLRE